MSHRCNLSTSAVRDNVSARRPPIQPTPITPTSTVFTAYFLALLRAHKDHAATKDATGRNQPILSSSAQADDPVIASDERGLLAIVDTGCPAFAGHDTSNITNRKEPSFSRRASSPERCKTPPREARRPGRTWNKEGWCLCFLIRYARLAKFCSLDGAQRNPGRPFR